jgi:hypothetical protein
MKRDMDLIRKILFKIESFPSDDDIEPIVLEGYTPEQINYHVYLIHEAGLIRGHILYGHGTVAPQSYVIFGLTWAGHDFLDACRDDSRWNKAKEIVTRMGGSVTFDALKSILVQLTLSQITTMMASGV